MGTFVFALIVSVIIFFVAQNSNTAQKPKTLREELTRPPAPYVPRRNWIRGEFYLEKFWEDQEIKKEIKEKMGDGYYDGCLIGIILNIGKVGVEDMLTQCEEAVQYYGSGKGEGCGEYDICTAAQKTEFFKVCVDLCKEQLEQINKGEEYEIH